MKCRASCQLCRCEIRRVMRPWLFCCKRICFSSLWSHIIRKCAGFLFRKYKIVSKNSPMVTHYAKSAVFATSTCLMDQFLCGNVSKNKTLETCRLGVKSNLLRFFFLFLYLQCFYPSFICQLPSAVLYISVCRLSSKHSGWRATGQRQFC